MRSRPCFTSSGGRSGGVTPLVVLSLAMLLGITAVCVDGGRILEERRHVQAAADAAALAAADDLYANYATNQGTDPGNTARDSALATAAANGYSNDGVNSVVTVTIAPNNYQGGPNKGNTLPAGYVEVTIQSKVGRTFSNAFGSGAVPVTGRAVARGQWTPIPNKVMALNQTTTGAVNVGGSSTLNILGGLLVNSKSSGAVSVSANAGLVATSITLNSSGGGLVGSVVSSLLALLGLGGGSTPPTTYIAPVPDPLRYLPDPVPSQLGLTVQGTNLNINGGTVNLYPGVYQGGITISGGASVTLHSNGNGTPGIYFLQGGGLTVSGPSSVALVAGDTAGVMIYNDWQTSSDAINLSGTGSMVLAPPSSGSYEGISIFQRRGTSASPAPALSIVGTGNVNIAGTIYVAYGDVTLSAVGNNNMGGQIIADTVTVNGSGTANINPNGKHVANSRILGLVE